MGVGGGGVEVKLYFIDRPQEMEESGAVMHMHVTKHRRHFSKGDNFLPQRGAAKASIYLTSWWW